MAGRRVSLLFSGRFSTSSSISSPVFTRLLGEGIGRNLSTAATAVAAEEEPITPPVQVHYTQLLINGQFVDAASAFSSASLYCGKTFPTLDPRTGEVIAHVAEGEAEDVNRAVAAARKAFDEGSWPRMTAYDRSRIMYRFADLIEKHNNEIAALETWDNGKPYEQAAEMEIPSLTRVIRYYAGWADKIHGLTVPADGPHHVQVLHEPIGVAGQIIPWNFPLLLYGWKVGPALACGNTIVVKTAEQTPLSALYVSKLAHEVPSAVQVLTVDITSANVDSTYFHDKDPFPFPAFQMKAGLPPGVLNVISGFGPTAGASLASHMNVDKLSFTGSTDTGRIVLELAARSNLKPVTLELGGKSPFIVCEDADVDKAVELAHRALFFNQGQCCCSGSRTFVHEHVYDEFVEKAKERALKRTVGDPFRKGVEQGPQIDEKQFNKTLDYIRSGVESGATLQAGGGRVGSKGYFIQPTIFSDVKDEMTIAREEIFGPVQSILKFKNIDEVMVRANATRYGLAAGVFTKNLNTANTLIRGLKVGTVWINCFFVFDAAIPFGGFKMSGQGREKGMYGLKNYLQVKAVVTPLENPAWL
ncbi:hypothetical protein Taro_051460 [Colocasia esculenta]|uniref:Aldehyde dehydrogenase domain-containing protein n=1 Tax=Colocasia esculenta TaxID=4460 RepID=A0A843XG08_COLES|nr:hypothetical protein [Colocasia esculenta]